MKYLSFGHVILGHIFDVFTAACGPARDAWVLAAEGRAIDPRHPLGPSGAHQKRHPSSFPGHRVAAAGQRHRHASEESVLGAAEDVIAVREAHPQGHRPHVP